LGSAKAIVATARKMVEMLYQISLTETIFDRSNGKNTLPGADYIGWKFTATGAPHIRCGIP
jgi:hypothetical protein